MKGNESLKSRRDFFKKAVKSALPILGAVVLASSPIVSKAATTMGCGTGSCVGYCYVGCGAACSNDCMMTCKGRCNNTCSGSCDGTCSGSCNLSSY